jgi:hypothetical protein
MDSQIIKYDKRRNDEEQCCTNTNQLLDLFNSKYYCKICRSKLRTKADEIIHLKYKHNKTVDSNQLIKCLFCSKKFKSYFSFKRHLTIKHLKEKPYGCNLCVDKSFTNFYHLKKHILRDHKKFESIKQLISYTNSKFNNKRTKDDLIIIKSEPAFIINLRLNCYKCKLCSKICLTEANYLVHTWEHFIKNKNKSHNQLVCWHCKSLKFNSFYDLEIHVHKKHLYELSYECNECKQSFYDYNSIKLHLNKAHLNVKIFKFNCLHCNLLFNTHKDVVFHTLRFHDNVNLYKCNLCDDKLKSKKTLNLHLEQHEFIQPTPATAKSPSNRRVLSLICEQCGYSFENSFFLNQHKSLHLSDHSKRPHKCHLCQVTFSKSEQLLRHMVVHQANELDYVCKVCYSTFSRKQDLDRHMHFHIK